MGHGRSCGVFLSKRSWWSEGAALSHMHGLWSSLRSDDCVLPEEQTIRLGLWLIQPPLYDINTNLQTRALSHPHHPASLSDENIFLMTSVWACLLNNSPFALESHSLLQLFVLNQRRIWPCLPCVCVCVPVTAWVCTKMLSKWC